MTKLSCGICFIEAWETLYQLVSHTLCFQFCGTFTTHLSSHKFKVKTKGGYEIVFHGIKCTLDLHRNQTIIQLDVTNAFNSVLRGVIFQKLRVAGVTSYTSSLLYMQFMHLNLHCFTIILIMKAMSQSSHLPWGLVRVIPLKGHYLF